MTGARGPAGHLLFVRRVGAVGRAVATPPAWDALAVLAAEVRRRALASTWAALFVGAVLAVVASIADASHLNAVAVARARELVDQAGARFSRKLDAVRDHSAESASED